MGVSPEELDKLIAEAGLGARSAQKLRKANTAQKAEDTPAPARQARGHGAPALSTASRGKL